MELCWIVRQKCKSELEEKEEKKMMDEQEE
jgi:hypothetical protein